MDSSDAERKQEKFLFHGVPEKPESTFELDNHSHVAERSTGRSLKPSTRDKRRGKWVVIGNVFVDRETETESFTPAEKKS